MVDSNLVIEAFTELAPRYVDTMDRELREFFGLGYQDFIHRLVGIAPFENCGLILDVATGMARIPLTMASQSPDGALSIGLDTTPAMLKYGLADIRARGLVSQIRLVCASAMDMPFVEGVFDLVFCGFAMHHMRVPRVLSEIARVLKEGGHLVMADVDAPSYWRSPFGSVILRVAAFLYGLTHKSARARAELAAFPNVHTTSEWQMLLLNLGFAEIEIMARLPGRRPWYPGALILKATKNIN